MTTRVFIDAKFDQPIHQGMAVLKELRRAGVPVLGILWPEGVQHGELTVTRVDKQTIYTWVPDPLLED